MIAKPRPLLKSFSEFKKMCASNKTTANPVSNAHEKKKMRENLTIVECLERLLQVWQPIKISTCFTNKLPNIQSYNR